MRDDFQVFFGEDYYQFSDQYGVLLFNELPNLAWFLTAFLLREEACQTSAPDVNDLFWLP